MLPPTGPTVKDFFLKCDTPKNRKQNKPEFHFQNHKIGMPFCILRNADGKSNMNIY